MAKPIEFAFLVLTLKMECTDLPTLLVCAEEETRRATVGSLCVSKSQFKSVERATCLRLSIDVCNLCLKKKIKSHRADSIQHKKRGISCYTLSYVANDFVSPACQLPLPQQSKQ